MTNDVKVKLNLRGINAVMTSRGVQGEVLRQARAMQARAGANFEVVSLPHKWTGRAFIRAANAQGAREEARDKRLTRAVGGR